MRNERNCDEVLDRIEEILENAGKMPLSNGKRLVDVEEILELIGEVRARMPQEILSAKSIVADRSKILKEAKSEGEEIIRKAEARAKDIVDNDDLIKQSKYKADEIISKAQLRARDVMRVAKEYTDGILNEAEETMSSNLSSIRKTRQNLKKFTTADIKRGQSAPKNSEADDDSEE